MKFNYEKLFEEVERKGIKFTYIAEQIGMTRQNLSRIKNNGGELTGTQITMICSILGSPISMFVRKG